MKIRQYIATTMQEARLKIKLDLGPDAVILHSRTVKKGGLFGFFGQNMVEVLAAVDAGGGAAFSGGAPAFGASTPAASPPAAVASIPPPPAGGLRPGVPGLPSAEPPAAPEAEVSWVGSAPLGGPVPGNRPTVVADPPIAPAAASPIPDPGRFEPPPDRRPTPATAVAPPTPAAAAARPAPAAAVAEVPAARDREVEELRAAMGEMRTMLSTIVEQLETQPVRTNWSATQQTVYDRLLKLEVDPALARGLITLLVRQGAAGGYAEQVDLLARPLASLLRCAQPPSVPRGEQLVIALIGPTGVGKTTTIAKLAANFRLTARYDIGLITIDTYRVAAVEQLKTYGDIIGIPVEVVLTPSALKDALAAFADKDVVLIDTAGRSPQNRMHLNELKGFLDIPQRHETHLVMSATTNRQNLKEIADSFGQVGYDRLVFTKLDETVSMGGPLSVAHALGKPISYVTDGQSVPDDLRVAEAGYLAGVLVDELKR